MANEINFMMANPNSKPMEQQKVIQLKDSDLTKEYFKLKRGKRWLPLHQWNIEEGEIKRIPKTELNNPDVMSLYEQVHNYKEEDDDDSKPKSKSKKKRVNVNAGGEINSFNRSSAIKQEGDIFKRYDINIDALLKGDSDEEIKIKKFDIDPVEIQTLVCNETGKTFDSREGFFRHKLLLFDKKE